MTESGNDSSSRALAAGVVEVGVYAVTVSTWVTAALLAVSVGVGWGLVGGNNALFVVGWLAFGVVAVRLFPTGYGERTTGTTGRSRFDSTVGRLPPLRWYWGGSRDPAATPLARQFGASVGLLVTSAALEFGLGVGT